MVVVVVLSNPPLPPSPFIRCSTSPYLPSFKTEAGYATHVRPPCACALLCALLTSLCPPSRQHTGKWHLGQARTAQVPASRGFDTSLAYLGGSEDHYTNTNGGCGGCGLKTDLYLNHAPAFGRNGTEFSAYLWTQHTIDLIMSHDTSSPLFVYHAAQCAHAPNEPDKFGELYSNATYTSAFIDYNGMASALDSAVKK